MTSFLPVSRPSLSLPLSLRWRVAETPWGPALAIRGDRGLVALEWLGDRSPTEVQQRFGRQFAGKVSMTPDEADYALDRQPLAPIGTPFQLQVWQALTEIPRGETRSYRQIAERIGRPSAVRAVANAIGRNPLLWLVPCHRVIASDGTLGGFSAGIELKRRMLASERRRAA